MPVRKGVIKRFEVAGLHPRTGFSPGRDQSQDRSQNQTPVLDWSWEQSQDRSQDWSPGPVLEIHFSCVRACPPGTIIDSNHFQLHPTPVPSAGGWDGRQRVGGFCIAGVHKILSLLDICCMFFPGGEEGNGSNGSILRHLPGGVKRCVGHVSWALFLNAPTKMCDVPYNVFFPRGQEANGRRASNFGIRGLCLRGLPTGPRPWLVAGGQSRGAAGAPAPARRPRASVKVASGQIPSPGPPARCPF